MNYAKKSLGHNFLKKQNIIKKIVSLIGVKGKNIIEIGPGNGALTDEIYKKKPKSLKIIEKDSHLTNELKKKYSKNKIIKIFNDDVLKFNMNKILDENTIIFGNLPYNISSQIFIKILRLKRWKNIHDIIFMFQKELGEKIISNYPSSNYGRLSILKELKLRVIKTFIVSPNCFSPRPKIKSIVIHFKPKKYQLIKIKKLENLEKITNILFSNKRKMINKNIRKILNENEISQIEGLELNLRPSEIKPKIFFKITELFEK